MNSIQNGCSNIGLKPNMNGNQKADDNSMMEVILKNTDIKSSNSQYGNPNGLPGVRNRTRQTNGGKLRINSIQSKI